MQLPQLILLNGTSSSGKTGIAHGLQEKLPVMYLNFSIDCILYALPPSDLRSMIEGRKIARSEYEYARLVRGFHAAITGLLATNNRLIIDNAITREEWRIDFDAAVAHYDIVRIGVLCDLDVARKREKARGDRAIGTAEAEFPFVHENMGYDLTVNTGICTTEKCVALIMDWLSIQTPR